MQFDAWDGRTITRCQVFARLGSAEPQMNIRLVCHSPDLRAHQGREKRVDEMQQRLPAPEIVRQGNSAPAVVCAPPEFLVFAKDFRIGEAKPIDALLDVTHEKSIRLRGFPA